MTTRAGDRDRGVRIVIVGASGGIGSALRERLAGDARVASVVGTRYRSSASDDAQLDITDEQAVAAWAETLGPIDWVVNCAGLLHTGAQRPEKSIGSVEAEFFLENIKVNCLASLLLARYLQPCLADSPQPLFAAISARIGSIADNRLGGWYSYRCAKAALNMALKTLSIEWQRTLPRARVLALHPGTTDTALSKPFQRNVPPASLFSADKTAGLLAERLFEAADQPSGRFIDYDGREIPW